MKSQSPSPINRPSTNTTENTAKNDTTFDKETDPIPLSSPLRSHPKRLLPPMLSSTYPHGHISGLPRTPEQQSAFDARRAEILRTMNAEQIEKAYEDVATQVRRAMDEAERTGTEVEEKMEKLKMDREMERRVWEKVKGMKEE